MLICTVSSIKAFEIFKKAMGSHLKPRDIPQDFEEQPEHSRGAPAYESEKPAAAPPDNALSF